MSTTTRRGLLSGAALSSAVAVLGGSRSAIAHAATAGRLREYWIAAEPFQHCLVPTGRDAMTGAAVDRSIATFWALRYRAYTPGWRRPLPATPALGSNDGMPGPTIRARVGDRIRVHFRNDDYHYKMNHGMHPHGVLYAPSSDGAEIAADPGRGGAIAPGKTYVYEWDCTPDTVGTWPYHDHAMSSSLPGAKMDMSMAAGQMDMSMAAGPTMELGAELGLFGIIAITDAHTPPVDREFILFFHDLYAADVPAFDRDWDCFNGFAYLGNTPTFTARTGERVRWRISALGTEFHVFHVHGHRWREADGTWRDSSVLGPSTTLTFDWVENNPGRWLYHCHVADHMMGGMIGHYDVSGRRSGYRSPF
jgi:FtsP/CotA-like multicopper oxidase with cupredoxin domain